jgi:preprotein translocase subunit SecD
MTRRRLAITLFGLLVVVFGSLAGNLVAGNEPSLGLDLQGGVSVTQEPVGDYNSESLDLAVERIRERVDSLGVAEPEIIRQGDAIVVNLPGVDNQDDAIKLVQVTGAVLLRPVLLSQVIETPDSTVTDDASTTTTTGASTDASTTTLPSESTTTLPGGPARPAAVTTVVAGTTVPSDAATTTTSVEAQSTTTTLGTSDSVVTTDAPASESTLPTDLPDPTDPNATVFVQNADGTELYQLGPAFATGEVFNNDAQADIISGGWGVRVTLRGGATGADLWNSGAARCFAKDSSCPSGRMAIVLDGVVQSAPSVNQPSFTGGVDITGSFTEGEAKDLARVLKSGALPVRLQVQAVQTVSPTLGSDSLRAAIISGLIGVGLVLLFMLLYYRSLAAIVVAGLLISGVIQWNVISLLSSTNGLALSLAGIAGIIVSIGVTVDSYVVFFEKLKDEVKSGRTLRNSAERGFKSAWRTILAADIVSLLGAFTLWSLTVGSVRGFAFFLGLSTLCDMIVAWFFTRPTMLLLARSEFIARRRVFGVDSSALTSGGAA